MKRVFLKKVLLMALALSLICGLFAACSSSVDSSNDNVTDTADSTDVGDSQDSENSAANTDNAEKVKIGYVGWGLTDTESRHYVRLLDYAAEACGFEIQYAVYSSVEDIIVQAEILIEAGCKGIIVLVASPALMDLCEENEVFLLQYASKINDDSVREYVEASDYWAGVSYTDNVGGGASTVKSLYDAGCRNILLCAPQPGIPCHDDRYNGAVAEAEKYDDLEFITWRAAESYGTEIGDAVSNYLNAYSEIDGIMATGGGDGACDSVVQAMDLAGVIGKVKFNVFDTVDNTAAYLEEGSLYSVGGCSLQGIVLCAITLQNAVLGCDWDYPVEIGDRFIWVNSVEEFREFDKYVLGVDTYPFSPEDYGNVSYNINKDCKLQDLYDMAAIPTIADFKALAE